MGSTSHTGYSARSSPAASLEVMLQIALIKVVFPDNHLVCDVTIILSVKKFHITIFDLYTRD